MLRDATVVCCDDGDRVERMDVGVRDGRIAALGAITERGTRELRLAGCAVLPGLIMAHVHLCQTLLRGRADDLPLLPWLQERIWPMEAAHDEQSLRTSAELGLVELLRAGATTLLDLGTVHDHDVVFDACARSGVRVFGGKSLMDTGTGVPKRLRESTRAALEGAERLEKQWNAHPSGRVRYAYIPRFILSCSERLLRGAVERADATSALLHTHASEHAAERETVRAEYGASDVRVLRRLGMRGPRCSFAHGVQLTRAEVALLARDGTGLVHCPSANLKLGSGVANVVSWLAAGIRAGLGADGAPCNNNLDPWVELRHAALLAAGTAGPGALPARSALKLATLGGARLLGCGDELGSIELGKRADLTVVSLRGAHLQPVVDPVAALVYSAQAQDVEHVVIDGRLVVEAGTVLTLDAEAVSARANEEGARLAARAGVGTLRPAAALPRRRR